MIQLKQDQLELIEPLMRERIEESNLGNRVTEDYVKTMLALNVGNGSGFVFVDSLENPQALLILSLANSHVLMEVRCTINIFHVAKDTRANSPEMAVHLSKVMFDYAESFATSKNCDTLLTASWVFRGAQDITPIIIKAGFEPQSKDFIKLLRETK